MELSLEPWEANNYKSHSQQARVLTEHWVETQAYCPSCGRASLVRYPNNKPVADFLCPDSSDDYELKSTRQATIGQVVDGAYSTMIQRLRDITNPNLFVLSYDPVRLVVKDFMVIPKHFFVPALIQKRRPLSPTARRAGWVGCNIALKDIPGAGRIFLVKDRTEEPHDRVLAQWKRTLFLRQQKDLSARGWMLDVMNCVERLQRNEFSLDDMYGFAEALAKKHPDNRHIKDKIRQQLQILRDRGYLEFVGRGSYRLRSST